jgi:hypothetical protein
MLRRVRPPAPIGGPPQACSGSRRVEHAAYSCMSESARLGTPKDRRKIGKMRCPPHRNAMGSPSAASNVVVRLVAG